MPSETKPAYSAETKTTACYATADGVEVHAGDVLDPVEARAFADSIHTAADVAEAEVTRQVRAELEDFYVNGVKTRSVSLPADADEDGAA